VVDLSKHRLYVYVRGVRRHNVQGGRGLSSVSHADRFLLHHGKLRPAFAVNGPYGVLGLGLSAFQPLLSDWQGGVVGSTARTRRAHRQVGESRLHSHAQRRQSWRSNDRCRQEARSSFSSRQWARRRGPAAGVCPRSRSPVLALPPSSCRAPCILGHVIRGQLCREEQVRCRIVTQGNSSDHQVGPGEIDLGDRAAFHAVRRHEADACVAHAHARECARPCSRKPCNERRVFTHAACLPLEASLSGSLSQMARDR